MIDTTDRLIENRESILAKLTPEELAARGQRAWQVQAETLLPKLMANPDKAQAFAEAFVAGHVAREERMRDALKQTVKKLRDNPLADIAPLRWAAILGVSLTVTSVIAVVLFWRLVWNR